MVPEDELEIGELRLLEVDNRVVLPVQTHIRVLITSADVNFHLLNRPLGSCMNHSLNSHRLLR